VVTFRDADYPSMLRQTEDGPVLLYVKGSIQEEDKFAIAIVGSRKLSPYGKLVTERLSSELSRSGFTIVSGMARGIDTVAHTNSITSGGRTIAVLGSGIDRAYPPENRGLMERIAASGYVASEFPCGTEPNKENFPRRNRLISGLSMGVVVVEAAAGSGALITAGSALEQNREVFAVPGNITSPNSAGTNELIKKGAKLIQKSDDIIEELTPMLRGYIKTKNKLKADVTEEEKKLCDILTGEPVHIDTLSRELSLSPAAALATLLGLEIKGIVRQSDGKRFYLVH
jgi:DNA processing protein